jgi:hypothetical protein
MRSREGPDEGPPFPLLHARMGANAQEVAPSDQADQPPRLPVDHRHAPDLGLDHGVGQPSQHLVGIAEELRRITPLLIELLNRFQP